MRKIIFALVLLMLAAPAWTAEVLITGVDQGDDANAVISFTNDTGQHVRAFALDIIVDGGAVISAVECLNADYYVYPGSIQISNNEVTDAGTCVCDAGEYDDTLPGLDSNGVTIEMASLYSVNDVEHPNAPADSGVLLKITLSGNDTQTVCIRPNGLRGGVVMEDASTEEPNAPCFTVDLPPGECMMDTHPDYANWSTHGKPDCWCYHKQCNGDIDGLVEGPFWVSLNDVIAFRPCFNQVVLPGGCECADLDHLQEGPFWVSLNDVVILRQYFNQIVVPDCDGTHINFWTN
jgi:hypothetical protein